MHHTRFEGANSTFDAKDLLNAFPLLAKPVVEIRARGDLSVFEPSMAFVPRLGGLPPPSIRMLVFKEIGDIFSQARLVVFGEQHIVAFQPMNAATHEPLGMHGIEAKNASVDQ